MFSPTPLRDILLVAGFELREMLRSRRAYSVIALYLLVATLATLAFVQILVQADAVVKNPASFIIGGRPGQGRGGILTPPPAIASAPSQAVLFSRNSPFRGLLSSMLTEKDTLAFILSKPPIALFYTLISFMTLPFLIMITSSETIAQEHQTRGVRFIAMRTGRAEFVLGKALGQGFLMGLVTLLSGGMCLAIAAWQLSDFEWGPGVSAVLLFWPRIAAYGAPFIGLAALCSMNSSSALTARAFSLLGLGGMWMIHTIASVYNGVDVPPILNLLDLGVPNSHQNALWRPDIASVGSTMAVLATLTALYLAIGLFFYRRRDL